ncbi:MAG: hypothetical protein U0587_08905 [Candidatus Binatia bacterium]
MRKLGVVSLGVFVGVASAAAVSAETITGEVVDTFCYTAMGARGASHKQCAIDCAKKGIPVGLLENGSNKLYVLLPNKDKAALPDNVIGKMGSEATITGKVLANGGSTFLTVESIK